MQLEDEPSLESVVLRAIKSHLATKHTLAPGYVLDYDRATQKAKIQLIVRGRKRDPDTMEVSKYRVKPLDNVPVIWPAGSAGSITLDLEEGDVVMVGFAERSIAEWLQEGGTDATPVDPRRFDISDAVAYPGTRSFAEPLGSDAVAQGACVWRSDDIRLGGAGADDFVALARATDQNFQNIRTMLQQLLIVLNLPIPVIGAVPAGAAAPIGKLNGLPQAPTVSGVGASKVTAL